MDSATLVSSDETTLDDVLHEEDVEGGEKERLAVVGGSELLDLSDGLVGVLLCFVHVPRLHAVHDGHEVDKDAEVVLRQPLEVVRDVGRHHLLVCRPSRRGHGLDGLLELLQHRLDRLHLADHKVVTNLEDEEEDLQVLLLLLGHALSLMGVLLHPGLDQRARLLKDRIGLGEFAPEQEQHCLAQQEEHSCIERPRHISELGSSSQNLDCHVILFLNDQDILRT